MVAYLDYKGTTATKLFSHGLGSKLEEADRHFPMSETILYSLQYSSGYSFFQASVLGCECCKQASNGSISISYRDRRRCSGVDLTYCKHPFETSLHNADLAKRKWGFCFVDGCPITGAATQKLIERIAFIRNTHYGLSWSSIKLYESINGKVFQEPSGSSQPTCHSRIVPTLPWRWVPIPTIPTSQTLQACRLSTCSRTLMEMAGRRCWLMGSVQLTSFARSPLTHSMIFVISRSMATLAVMMAYRSPRSVLSQSSLLKKPPPRDHQKSSRYGGIMTIELSYQHVFKMRTRSSMLQLENGWISCVDQNPNTGYSYNQVDH